MKPIKILFIGLGSIGQRHLQNIQTIYNENVSCSAVRTTFHNNFIKDGVAEVVISLSEHYNICIFNSIAEAFSKQKYDAVFITNPSSHHFETILNCLNYNINIFVEKPLCINLNQANEIKNKLINSKSILYVGYQTRFDPIHKKVHDLINANELGNIVSARFDWCTYLPDHHKYEDYRKGYAARGDLGGGVFLGLSHEIDMIISFFGMPSSIATIKSSNKKLEIAADDTVMCLCKYSKNNFPLSLVLSYSQVSETRGFRIQFDSGLIDCDLNNRTLNITDRNKSVIPDQFKFNLSRNEIFKLQTKKFLDSVLLNDSSITNIDESVNILKFIESAESRLM